MRHRPKRENYDRGIYADINYQERLERYCTYLENRNKELTEQCNIADVVGQSEQSCKHPESCAMGYYHQINDYYCSKCQNTGL